MSVAAPFLLELEAAAELASAAEADYRRDSAARLRQLTKERAFAHRRLTVMRDIARAAAEADSEEAAVERALAGLRVRLGWPDASEAHAAILSRFGPVVRAAHANLCGGSEPSADVGAALAGFEAWYGERYPTSFWDLFERPALETPLVDF